MLIDSTNVLLGILNAFEFGIPLNSKCALEIDRFNFLITNTLTCSHQKVTGNFSRLLENLLKKFLRSLFAGYCLSLRSGPKIKNNKKSDEAENDDEHFYNFCFVFIFARMLPKSLLTQLCVDSKTVFHMNERLFFINDIPGRLSNFLSCADYLNV